MSVVAASPLSRSRIFISSRRRARRVVEEGLAFCFDFIVLFLSLFCLSGSCGC